MTGQTVRPYGVLFAGGFAVFLAGLWSGGPMVLRVVAAVVGVGLLWRSLPGCVRPPRPSVADRPVVAADGPVWTAADHSAALCPVPDAARPPMAGAVAAGDVDVAGAVELLRHVGRLAAAGQLDGGPVVTVIEGEAVRLGCTASTVRRAVEALTAVCGWPVPDEWSALVGRAELVEAFEQAAQIASHDVVAHLEDRRDSAELAGADPAGLRVEVYDLAAAIGVENRELRRRVDALEALLAGQTAAEAERWLRGDQ